MPAIEVMKQNSANILNLLDRIGFIMEIALDIIELFKIHLSYKELK